jgi:2-polyprenyl-3-methyl-5-hydroxy-6-metoxy-1,4-benzoquinol methylase
MLGNKLDYMILRPFTHSRLLKTEEKMNEAAAQNPTVDTEYADLRLSKLFTRLEGHFPISNSLRYLDVGCGPGDITLALARAGCGHVTGVDMVDRYITRARLGAQQLKLEERVEFVRIDFHDWQPPHRFDVILSHEALEHIREPRAFFARMADLLAPGGVAVLAFGPLFHSPVGDHMDGFFRVPIPWRGALFSEKAILRLRRERYRPTEFATRYQEISGSLNLMRYSEFLRYVTETGWEFQFLSVNPQLKRFPFLFQSSNALVRMPLIQDYFATSVYTVLRRQS